MRGQKIAVIGGGISGNLVARLLCVDHEVTLFEAADYPGGHSKTVSCEIEGKEYAVDIGFMVFNERTYPNFCQMLDWLKVESQASDMSFSVRCEATSLEYQGSSIRGLFPDWQNVISPGYWKMLWDILRFNRLGTKAIRSGSLKEGETTGQFLDRCRMGRMFREKYLLPMAAAIWSAEPAQILDFPAQFFLGFCDNHGLMQVRNRPQWKTIVDGSQAYVAKLLEPLEGRIRLNCPVRKVIREGGRVYVLTDSSSDASEVESFDQVIFATHADQTLRMLTVPSDEEAEILGHFPYQPNQAVLHTDTSILPRSRHAWASWNYLLSSEDQTTASVTYDLSRLQNVPSPVPILLSLNVGDRIDPNKVLQTFNFDHPAFNRHSLDAQKRLKQLQGKRQSYFCGAWTGYGFHEDGVRSALAVAAYFGKNLETCKVACTKETFTTHAMPPESIVSRTN